MEMRVLGANDCGLDGRVHRHPRRRRAPMEAVAVSTELGEFFDERYRASTDDELVTTLIDAELTALGF
jgi:hypothetical protein